MTEELIAFLRAQLDDDERVANIVSAGGYDGQTWRAGPSGPGPVGVLLFGDDHMTGDPPDVIEEAYEPFAVVFGGRAEDQHIIRWDPARVLAEIEAKRRILDLHEPIHGYDPNGPVCSICGEQGNPGDEAGVVRWPCMTMRLLAQPYAGREGWREEWRS